MIYLQLHDTNYAVTQTWCIFCELLETEFRALS